LTSSATSTDLLFPGWRSSLVISSRLFGINSVPPLQIYSMKTALLKKPAKRRSAAGKKVPKKSSTGYDEVKLYEGQQYTGMAIGRSHKWYYDKGDWRETKITPDLWEISYAVTKRRAGHAPEGSGVPKGTEYQWYIMAYQNVGKLNKDDYSTELKGLKFKLAHKRANKEKWSISIGAQRKKLIKLLQEMIKDLQKEPVKIEFEYDGDIIKGEVLPISQTCHEGICSEFDIFINNRHTGIIKRRKSGWKMDNAPDQKFINAVGKAIEEST
jgi:hypothetical protein